MKISSKAKIALLLNTIFSLAVGESHLPHPSVSMALICHNKHVFISGYNDGKVALRDVANSSKIVTEYQAHAKDVNRLAFCHNR